ncbi:hypothetical protein [Desulfurobacterium sp.]|uniref:hypothetical protein n=1 Tax=Desulfurobacterium sp. TaxID=2004706 RepID=UPI00260770A0|nr:hypothetical protein [Desulfurobacterium sp.]
MEMWFAGIIGATCLFGMALCFYPLQKVEAERKKGITVLKNISRMDRTDYYYLEKAVEDVFLKNPSVSSLKVWRFCDWSIVNTDGKIKDRESIKRLKWTCVKLFSK